MQLDIRGVKYELSSELMEFIERRLGFALGRFASRIDTVEVRLCDVNGPRGGVDKQCRIAVALFPRGSVRVVESGQDPFALVACAVKRAGRTVHRVLGRQRRARACA